MFEHGYDLGISFGEDKTNSEIAAAIDAEARKIHELITLEGFDASTADHADEAAGFIAGISQRINL